MDGYIMTYVDRCIRKNAARRLSILWNSLDSSGCGLTRLPGQSLKAFRRVEVLCHTNGIFADAIGIFEVFLSVMGFLLSLLCSNVEVSVTTYMQITYWTTQQPGYQKRTWQEAQTTRVKCATIVSEGVTAGRLEISGKRPATSENEQVRFNGEFGTD